MSDEIRDAYADGFNQTGDLRFVLRRLPGHELESKILQQRYVRRIPGYGSPIEQDRWIDVPLYSGGA
jgi:hypothetical protein